ncbi:hypothetical protein [Arsukibacterium indicum]|uniref:Sugar 3,4-ketoisomerase QdtA cupin domain-containing protein n=1 Tax=Arsukibacterium indicum TaxID=2848612 RepID=A0ABS6MHA6_9GAMM|nr:hypothetical protein [Arsukibacterium indicum]MBV2128182.1 hypothetical protein [Arsukibacterium indicum]
MRKPDFVIGDNYMHRWWLIPRNRYFNIYLHKIMRNDDDRALHDHPWWSLSVLLKGKLREVLHNRIRYPLRFIPLLRSAKLAHRLEVVEGPVWTLFITGPVIRSWGFHCPKGFVPWKDFVDDRDAGKTGRGCGEQ